MGMGFSFRKNAFFQAPIKLVQPYPAPELQANIFLDTKIFLNKDTNLADRWRYSDQSIDVNVMEAQRPQESL